MNLQSAANPAGIRTETISFENVPSQSALFLDFLNPDSSRSKAFWPNSDVPLEIYAKTAIGEFNSDRDVLCDGLSAENNSYGSTAATTENIDRLRSADSVAVITGQQAGLFSGPAYTVYKALSVVRIAQELRGKGVNAVPVFWIATEDHDFEEISRVSFVGKSGNLVTAQIDADEGQTGVPVGNIRLPIVIENELKRIGGELGKTAHSGETLELLEASYEKGTALGVAFGKLLTSLLGKHGIIFVNPLNPVVRKLSAPLIAASISKSDDIRSALLERKSDLDVAGFHNQVLVDKYFLPLFLITDDGKRRSLTEVGGTIRSKDGEVEYSREELLDLVRVKPEAFSPNALLRPVVQDFVFPTLCYVGGAAEIAYFAQNSSVYKVLGRPVTPIRHRSGFTVLEARHGRTMAAYGLSEADVFAGFNRTIEKLASKSADAENIALFDEMEKTFRNSMEELAGRLSGTDPGLAASAEKRMAKVLWHVTSLRKKYIKAEAERDGDRTRRLNDLFGNGLPAGTLQERTVSFMSLFYHHGPKIVDWVYDSTGSHGNQHKFLYI